MNRLPTIRVAALVLACGLTTWASVRSQQPKTDTENPAGQPAAPKAEAGKPKELIDTEAPAAQPAAPKATADKPKQLIDTEETPGQPAAPKAAERKELIDTENPGNAAQAAVGASLPADALLKSFASYNAHQPSPGGDLAKQLDGEIKQLSDLTAFRYRLAVAAAQLRGGELAALKVQLRGEVEQARSQAEQAAKELKALRDGASRVKTTKAAGAAKGQPAKIDD